MLLWGSCVLMIPMLTRWTFIVQIEHSNSIFTASTHSSKYNRHYTNVKSSIWRDVTEFYLHDVTSVQNTHRSSGPRAFNHHGTLSSGGNSSLQTITSYITGSPCPLLTHTHTPESRKGVASAASCVLVCAVYHMNTKCLCVHISHLHSVSLACWVTPAWTAWTAMMESTWLRRSRIKSFPANLRVSKRVVWSSSETPNLI